MTNGSRLPSSGTISFLDMESEDRRRKTIERRRARLRKRLEDAFSPFPQDSPEWETAKLVRDFLGFVADNIDYYRTRTRVQNPHTGEFIEEEWVKICGDATVALTPLKLVLSQALVRILCPECREAYRPDPALIAKANLNADQITELYRPPTKPRLDEKGKPLVDVEGNPIPCPGCRGTGYYGRTGVFEHMAVTDELRQLVIAGESLNRIKASCRKNKMLYLQEQALRKVTDNVTSIQEVIRVTQPSGKPKKQ